MAELGAEPAVGLDAAMLNAPVDRASYAMAEISLRDRLTVRGVHAATGACMQRRGRGDDCMARLSWRI